MGSLDTAQAERIANGAPGPDTIAARNEAHGLVLKTLSGLPEDQQEAFRLKFQDQLTYREISQITGKSLGTVSKLVTTALSALRNELRPGHLGLAQEV